MKKHQKHAKLAKPETGHFGRNELALVGAPCGLIQDLADQVIGHFSELNITYIDADHAFGDSEVAKLNSNLLIDKIKFYRHDQKVLNAFDKKIALSRQDLILVNGNHFEAQKQLVFVHPKKEASLKKRLSQLTHALAYVICDEETKPFDWLINEIGTKPILYLKQVKEIADLVKSTIKNPPLKGLVLAGGKSLRMGEDKGQIDYHGLNQVDYLLAEFKKTGIEAFVSCRTDQYQDYKRITDKFEGLGPYGAILSAFQSDPNAAWLVSACDLPQVNTETFKHLLEQRDASKFATCFYNAETDFPDPLITLWEPKSYMRLLEFLGLGFSCPRKVLINSEVKLIQTNSLDLLKNVNTPEEKDEFLSHQKD